MNKPASNRVLITGGATFTGINFASAVLAEGAEVTLLLREGDEARLGPLKERVQWHVADVWDAASLKGRARGHRTVIHTVGSMTDDPARGLTFQRLNVTSARHVANMCVSDGVSHLVLMSAARAPWINGQYVSAKRDAEAYLQRIGLRASIVRAPLTYIRGNSRPVFYRLMTLLGTLPPLSWTPLGNVAPISMDVLARGVARLALNPPPDGQRIYQAREICRLNTSGERHGRLRTPSTEPADSSSDMNNDDTLPRRPSD